MSFSTEISELVDELGNVEINMVQAIINYCKSNKRASQKSVGELFDVPIGHVKTIKQFIKNNSFDHNLSQSDLDSSSQTTISEQKVEFLSVAEMTKYFKYAGGDVSADGAKGDLEPTKLLSDRMSTSGGSQLCTSIGNISEFNPADEFNGEKTSGEKVIDYVKWFVTEADKEIVSLRADAESFDAERNGHKQEKHRLNELLQKKKNKIAELTAKLANANKMRKENVCSRCENQKKYVVGGLRFCGNACIKEALQDLQGAYELPSK